MTQPMIPGFRKVPQTGVVYVMHRAIEHGYQANDPSWMNLGQGAPETGAMTAAPPRIQTLNIDPTQHEYSPISGQIELRQRVADFYNRLYRQNKSSQYTWENVSISGGGRIALTRIAASLGNINMGHFLPDYTAYEELLSIFKAFVPIPILVEPANHYSISPEQIKKEIMGRGLQAILMSNPCNPTGQLIQGENLRQWVEHARNYHCSLIIDEFYSHYIYDNSPADSPTMVSAAEYVDDVNQDPIVIVDGLTKNWRYPGWRVGWTVAPKSVIQTITSSGSFLDGGASNLLQKQVIRLLDPEYVLQETAALQACFSKKRSYTIRRLQELGIKIDAEPQGTFYIWANLSELPPPLNDGFQFFELGLKEKVITVPGVFFDVNPEKRRAFARYRQYSRISFGPEMNVIERGLDAIERLIKQYK